MAAGWGGVRGGGEAGGGGGARAGPGAAELEFVAGDVAEGAECEKRREEQGRQERSRGVGGTQAQVDVAVAARKSVNGSMVWSWRRVVVVVWWWWWWWWCWWCW